ncbi:hypothetical protein B0H11DRAFT_1903912 [Mycena galericulata]|nr:hypothetical protein B0H11DRAFT_1903912 [Mycena galericulata]
MEGNEMGVVWRREGRKKDCLAMIVRWHDLNRLQTGSKAASIKWLCPPLSLLDHRVEPRFLGTTWMVDYTHLPSLFQDFKQTTFMHPQGPHPVSPGANMPPQAEFVGPGTAELELCKNLSPWTELK